MYIETGVNELNTLYRSTGLTTGQVYRVINSGNLEPNALTVKFGDFVRWDGSKWVKSTTELATTADVDNVINKWIKRRNGTAGTYTPEEGEEIHLGSIVITENGLIRITSQAQIDPDTGDVYYTYQTTDLSNAVVGLEQHGMSKFVCTYDHNEHTGNRTFSEVLAAYLHGDLVCLEVGHSDGSKTLAYLSGISETTATFLYIAYTHPYLYKVTCTASGWTHESKEI